MIRPPLWTAWRATTRLSPGSGWETKIWRRICCERIGFDQGHSLTEVTACLAERLGLRATILPMCDEEVPTMVIHGRARRAWLSGVFREIRLEAGDSRDPPSRLREGACFRHRRPPGRCDADIVLIAPSNPWLSLAPIWLAGLARFAGEFGGAGGRGDADHRRRRGQGTDGEDHARAGAGGFGSGSRPLL